MQEFNYGTISESVGIEIHKVSPVWTRPSLNDRKKMAIIPADEPGQVAVAFEQICEWMCVT